VPQILRDNAADPRVDDDIRALSEAYDDDSVTASVEAMRAARADDLEVLAAAFVPSDPAGQTAWQRALDHVSGYRLYYLGAVAVLLVLLFVSPAPLPSVSNDDSGSVLIPTSDSAHTAATSPVTSPAFVSSEPFEFTYPGTDVYTAEPAPEFSAPPVTSKPAPRPLRITQSGYASSFAGTPADQEPPGKGLPAEVIGGQVTKYSYLKLAGDTKVLRLKALSDDGASLNDAEARVQMCHITTAAWSPKRDVAKGDAPKYNTQCLEGKKGDGGVWTFTFSAVNDPLDANGWAVVPITADNATFRVTFAPTAA
jgi:hypothetical protein